MKPAQVKLGQIAEVQLGITLRGTDAARHDPSGTHHLIRIGDLTEDGGLQIATLNLIKLDDNAADRFGLRQGEVIMASRGVRVTAAVFDGSRPAVAGNQFCVLRLKSSAILPAFLRWFLNLAATQEKLRACMTGSYVRSLPVGAVADLVVPFPGVDQQRAVVALDALRVREKRLLGQIATKRSQFVDYTILHVLNR
jgi:hypothetical protein